MPLITAHSNSFLYFLLILWETHDIVWEITSVSEKRIEKTEKTEKLKNCIVKINDNVFEKNDEGGLFPLISWRSNWKL